MASRIMMFLPDSTSVQTPEVPKLLSNVIFGAFEVTAPAVHGGGGGGMPPQSLIQPGVDVSGVDVSGVDELGVDELGVDVSGVDVLGVDVGQLTATESLPFLMSNENVKICPEVVTAPIAKLNLKSSSSGSGSRMVFPGQFPPMFLLQL
jgi:hypothetical protein